MRMPFAGRIERAEKLSQEQAQLRRGKYDEEIIPADIMEKGDGCAMVIAAMITIVPIALIVVVALAAAGYFFIMR